MKVGYAAKDRLNSTEMWIVQTFLPTVGVVYIISNEAGVKMMLVETFSLVTRETDGKKTLSRKTIIV